MVCRLKRSLYGLKQASQALNTKFDSFLVNYGFRRSAADPCVYVHQYSSTYTIMAIWIDNGLICSSSPKKLKNLIEYLNRNSETTCGPVSCFVGI